MLHFPQIGAAVWSACAAAGRPSGWRRRARGCADSDIPAGTAFPWCPTTPRPGYRRRKHPVQGAGPPQRGSRSHRFRPAICCRWRNRPVAEQQGTGSVFSFSRTFESRLARPWWLPLAPEYQALRLAFDLQHEPVEILRILTQLLHELIDLRQGAVGDFDRNFGAQLVEFLRKLAHVGEHLAGILYDRPDGTAGLFDVGQRSAQATLMVFIHES